MLLRKDFKICFFFKINIFLRSENDFSIKILVINAFAVEILKNVGLPTTAAYFGNIGLVAVIVVSFQTLFFSFSTL